MVIWPFLDKSIGRAGFQGKTRPGVQFGKPLRLAINAVRYQDMNP